MLYAKSINKLQRTQKIFGVIFNDKHLKVLLTIAINTSYNAFSNKLLRLLILEHKENHSRVGGVILIKFHANLHKL